MKPWSNSPMAAFNSESSELWTAARKARTSGPGSRQLSASNPRAASRCAAFFNLFSKSEDLACSSCSRALTASNSS